jgi:glycosyltransferase involved in cell wall biosynthesis
MREVLTDDGLRERLASAGLARAAHFSWDAVATRAWTLYRELATGTG